MDADEREIINYLQTWGANFVNGKEIARRASTKKRFHEDPEWAKPVLVRLVEKGLLENDASGRYRLKPDNKHDKTKRWVAPNLKEILEEGGVKVEGAETHRIEEDDV